MDGDEGGKSAGKCGPQFGNGRVWEDLKVEFALQKIAEEEKIVVEDKEIEEAIQKAKDETEKKHLESNRYLLASILRQQKTLDFIKNLW